jgi:hypothetical protein
VQRTLSRTVDIIVIVIIIVMIAMMMPHTTPHAPHAPYLMATFSFSTVMSNCFAACVSAQSVTILQCDKNMVKRTPIFKVPDLG